MIISLFGVRSLWWRRRAADARQKRLPLTARGRAAVTPTDATTDLSLCQTARSYPLHHHHVLAVFIKYTPSIKATFLSAVTVSELVWTVVARSLIRTYHRLQCCSGLDRIRTGSNLSGSIHQPSLALIYADHTFVTGTNSPLIYLQLTTRITYQTELLYLSSHSLTHPIASKSRRTDCLQFPNRFAYCCQKRCFRLLHSPDQPITNSRIYYDAFVEYYRNSTVHLYTVQTRPSVSCNHGFNTSQRKCYIQGIMHTGGRTIVTYFILQQRNKYTFKLKLYLYSLSRAYEYTHNQNATQKLFFHHHRTQEAILR